MNDIWEAPWVFIFYVWSRFGMKWNVKTTFLLFKFNGQTTHFLVNRFFIYQNLLFIYTCNRKPLDGRRLVLKIVWSQCTQSSFSVWLSREAVHNTMWRSMHAACVAMAAALWSIWDWRSSRSRGSGRRCKDINSLHQ